MYDHLARRWRRKRSRRRTRQLGLELLESRLLLSAVGKLAPGDLILDTHLLQEEDLAALQNSFGVTDLGTWQPVMVDGHTTGYRAPTAEEWQAMVGSGVVVDSITLPPGVAQPAALDWTTSIYFPPIGNQDGEGSCTCWSVAYYTKTFQEAQEHGWDLSTVNWVGGFYGEPDSQQDHIFSPDFLYHQINDGYDGGSWFDEAVEVIYEIGAATWSTMPYDPTDSTTWPDEPAWREAPIYRGSDSINYLDVSTSVEGLKALLASGNLAQMAIDSADMYEMSTLDNFLNLDLNHAQTIVGYDDNWTYTEQGQTRYGAFKVANSWGPTWTGETTGDGCWWISYEALMQRVGQVTFFNDLTGYEPETLAVFGIDHVDRGQTYVALGVGDPLMPTDMKDFFTPLWSSDGNDPYPANLMALDISELAGGVGTPYFLEVWDWGPLTGTITSFSVEQYTDYASGVPDSIAVSLDPPVDTEVLDYVYAMTAMAVPGIDLVPTALSYAPDVVYGETEITVDYTVHNQGDTGFVDDFDISFYLSDDDAVGGGDILLDTVTVPGGLPAMTSVVGSQLITGFPATDPFVTDNDYYLLISADSGGDVDEGLNEGNNVLDEEISWARRVVFEDDFSNDLGWTGYSLGRWERGAATAGGGEYGFPDPGFDTTDTVDEFLLGYNIGGDYSDSMGVTEWITSPAINCSAYEDVAINFEQWLNVESSWYDHAYIQVFSGGSWQTIYENGAWDTTDSEWQDMQYDVSAYADGNADFQVRFGMGPTDSSWRYSGWNVDDFEVMGTLEIEYVPPQVSSLSVGPVVCTPLTSIEVFFDEPIEPAALADPANYVLTGLLGPVSVDNAVADTDSVLLEINGGLPLVEDIYTLTVVSGGIADFWLNPLDGNGDGVGGDDFTFEFDYKTPGLPGGQLAVGGATITFYDTDAGSLDEVDVRPLAIVATGASGMRSVTLLPQYSSFGVVIEQAPGSDTAVAIYDRTYSARPISFIVADCDVSTLSVSSNLTGWDLNGMVLGANVTLALDVDDDGNTEDLCAFIGLGNVGTLRTNARIMGDVVVYGDMGNLLASGVNSMLGGQVYVGGGLSRLQSSTAIGDRVTVDGHVGTIRALGGTGALGTIAAGAGLDNLYCVGDMLGGLSVFGDLGTLSIARGDLGATGDATLGQYDAGLDNLIYNGGDGWQLYDRLPGTQSDLLFFDADADAGYTAGEDLWQDGTGGGAANGQFDWEYEIDDGGDGWDTAAGTAGIQGDLLFADTSADNRFGWNEEIWADVDLDGFYTDGVDTQIYLGENGVWDTADGAPGEQDNLYFDDTGDGLGGAPDGLWEDGEEIWADALSGDAGQYNAIEETRVYDGADGWDLADGSAGIQGDVQFYDEGDGAGGPPNGLYDTGEDIWSDVDGGRGDIAVTGSITKMTVLRGDVTGNGLVPRITVGGTTGTFTVQNGDLVGGVQFGGRVSTFSVIGGQIGMPGDGGLGDVEVLAGGIGTLRLTNGDVTDTGILDPRLFIVGDVGRVTISGGSLLGALQINSDLDYLYVSGVLDAPVVVDGRIGQIITRGGITANSGLAAMDGLGTLRSYGDVLGTVYSGGPVGTVYVMGGDLGGDIIADNGGVDVVRVVGGDVTDNGNPDPRIEADGRVGMLYVSGQVQDDLAAGSWGRVQLMGAGGFASALTSGGGIDYLHINGGLTGDVIAAGHIATATLADGLSGNLSATSFGRIQVTGNFNNGTIAATVGGLDTLNVTGGMFVVDVTVTGRLNSLSVGGPFTDSNVGAGLLTNIRVRGQITGTGAEEIVADAGSFTISDADERLIISDAVGHDFAGVQAYVDL